jgi:hypothetical protein
VKDLLATLEMTDPSARMALFDELLSNKILPSPFMLFVLCASPFALFLCECFCSTESQMTLKPILASPKRLK